MKSQIDRSTGSRVRIPMGSASCFVTWAIPVTWAMVWTPFYRLAYEAARDQVRETKRRARLLGHVPPSMN